MRSNCARVFCNTRERIQRCTPCAALRTHSRLRRELKIGLPICRNRLTRFAKAASYLRHPTRSNLPGMCEHLKRSASMHPEHRSIGELAYRLWQARGCPDGTAEQDWLEAEKQLEASRPARARSSEAVDDSLKSTFPASDPPASHLPDVPPANAAAKWKAAEASHEKPARAEPSSAQPARTNPPRRRLRAKSEQSLPGESKPTSLSKPRNDTAS